MNKNTTVVEVSINDLVKDPNHPREDVGDLESLVCSLQTDGLLNPITVMQKKDDPKLYVIDGWRRVYILKDFGEKSIPCIILEGCSDDMAAHKSYVLNTEHHQLNAVETALHIKRLRDKFGYSYSDLEIKGYGSKAQLSKKLKILELPEDVQKKIVKGELSVAHGMELLELETDKERLNMAAIAVRKELSAKATEKAITKYKNKSKIDSTKGSTETVSSYEASEKDAAECENILGTTIYYKSSEDMSAIEDESVQLIFTSPPGFAEKAMESKNYTFDDYFYEIEMVMEESARVLVKGGILALNITDIHDFKEKMNASKTPHIELMATDTKIYLKIMVSYWRIRLSG